jgi:hypothetical protein
MRLSNILIPIALVLSLLVLTLLPTGYAQPTQGTSAQYLPAVFKSGPTETPTVTPWDYAYGSPTPSRTSMVIIQTVIVTQTVVVTATPSQTEMPTITNTPLPTVEAQLGTSAQALVRQWTCLVTIIDDD